MSDIQPASDLSAESRGTLALIDALRERGAVEVSIDGVYAKFAGASADSFPTVGVPPPFAEPVDHEREAAITAYRKLQGIFPARDR